MPLNIVLLEPEIHTNTGNIGRLSLAAGANLHLVKPLGFELSDSRIKRAGLDYWKHINLSVHDSFTDFLAAKGDAEMVFFTRHATRSYTEATFSDNMYLIFGKESVGLPKQLIASNKENSYSIPIYSEKVRSLNLANAVSIVVYEGLRQIRS